MALDGELAWQHTEEQQGQTKRIARAIITEICRMHRMPRTQHHYNSRIHPKPKI
jgi:hypothetical protein